MKYLFLLLVSFVSINALAKSSPYDQLDPKKKEKFDQSPLGQEYHKNPNLMQEFVISARMVPNIGSKGDVIGIKFIKVKKNSKWDKWGVKPGDVLIGVDNEKLEPMSLFEFYKKYEADDRPPIKKMSSDKI